MKIDTLLELYPQAKKLSSPINDESLLCLHDQGEYAAIPLSSLTDSEILLLKKVFESKNHSDWYDYLINHTRSMKNSTHTYQVIQFKTTVKNKDITMWINTLCAFFNRVIDSFLIDHNSGMIVIESQEIDQNSLEGFVVTLDDDFSSKTSLYIGESYPLSKTHSKLIDEERNLFNNSKTINTFKNSYLPSLIKPQLDDSLLGQEIKTKIMSQSDPIELIQALWKNQANISKTAQDLFLHRNTLNYRMDKFYEEVGLSLRDLDDLLICYLITL